MNKSKESINNIIADQDTKIDKKTGKQLHPMLLQITDISSKQSDQSKLFSTYEKCLENIRNNKKSITKFDTERIENEEYFKMKFYGFKSTESSPIDTGIPNLSSKKSTSSYDQPSSDLIKWPLLNSPDFHSHASKFTKHL